MVTGYFQIETWEIVQPHKKGAILSGNVCLLHSPPQLSYIVYRCTYMMCVKKQERGNVLLYTCAAAFPLVASCFNHIKTSPFSFVWAFSSSSSISLIVSTNAWRVGEQKKIITQWIHTSATKMKMLPISSLSLKICHQFWVLKFSPLPTGQCIKNHPYIQCKNHLLLQYSTKLKSTLHWKDMPWHQQLKKNATFLVLNALNNGKEVLLRLFNFYRNLS